MCIFALAPAAAAGGSMMTAANVAANVGLIGSLAGTAMSAAGQYQQQKSANAQAKYQAQVAENNALTQNRLAEYALEKGRLDERRQRAQTARLKGQQRLGYAVSGVEMDDGSPLDTLEDTAGAGAVDALNVRHGANLQAWQHRNSAIDQQAQAGLYASRVASPLTQSLPTLVSGAARVAEKWEKYASSSSPGIGRIT